MFFALAAFPPQSMPDLVGVSFGITYDPQAFVLVGTGSCAESEVNTENWPAPGSGTALTWSSGQGKRLLELRWFAGYAASAGQPAEFTLTAHPTQGGWFLGDGVTGPIDPIAGYGRLGFGTEGSLTCPEIPGPTVTQTWGGVKAQYR